MKAGLTRCIPIQCGACRRRYGVVPVGAGRPRCPHRSDAGTEIRDSVNEALQERDVLEMIRAAVSCTVCSLFKAVLGARVHHTTGSCHYQVEM